MNLATTQ